MSLQMYYTNDFNEEKTLTFSILLNVNVTDEVEIFEHPSETKTSFSDSCLEVANDIPIKIYIPSEEEVTEIVRTPENVTKIIDGEEIAGTGLVQITEKRTKHSVYKLLKKLQLDATIIDFLNINGQVYSANNTNFSGYNIKSLAYEENISVGDGWDLDIVFKPARIVSARKTRISPEILARLRALSSSGNTSSKKSIDNANKTSKPKDLGDAELLKEAAKKRNRIEALNNGTLTPFEFEVLKADVIVKKYNVPFDNALKLVRE